VAKDTWIKDTLTPRLEGIIGKFWSRITESLAEGGVESILIARRLSQERLKNPGSYATSFEVEIKVGKEPELDLKNKHRAARVIEFGTFNKPKGYPVPRTGKSAKLERGTGEKKGKKIPSFWHPGLPARHIIRDTIRQVMPKLIQKIKEKFLEK